MELTVSRGRQIVVQSYKTAAVSSALHRTGFPDSSVGKESTCGAGDPGLIPGLGRSAGEGIGYPLQSSWISPCGSAGKESACNVGDLGLIPGLGRSPAEGNSYPFQYSGLENSMDNSPWGRKEPDVTK